MPLDAKMHSKGLIILVFEQFGKLFHCLSFDPRKALLINQSIHCIPDKKWYKMKCIHTHKEFMIFYNICRQSTLIFTKG